MFIPTGFPNGKPKVPKESMGGQREEGGWVCVCITAIKKGGESFHEFIWVINFTV